MRYIIYGAGAIGGGIGGRLHQAGHEVLLICRGAHLDAIQRDGLLLRAPEGDVRLPVPAVGHPRDIVFTPDDAVVLTMKTQDTERALHDLQTHGGADLPIICAQNGVENERLAARRFRRVYGMVVAMPATFLTPGEVIVEGTPITGVLHTGRWPTGIDDLAEQVCQDITASHMLAEAAPDVMRLKYTKLLSNLGNAIQVVTGAMRGSDESRAFMAEVRAEAVRLYDAAGIGYVSEQEYTERVSRFLRIGEVAGVKRSGSSTWQSIQRGHTTIEVDALNGEIALLGAQLGLPAPYNAVLRRVAVQMAASGAGAVPLSFGALRELVEAEDARTPVAS